MYKGKRVSRRARKSKKIYALLVSLVLVVSLGIGATLAYLMTSSDRVENIFEPGKVPPIINEPEWNGQVKKNVTVTNNGNVPAYIRAAISVSWQKTVEDDQENDITLIASDAPILGTHYTLTLGDSTKWIKGSDGYYYYTVPVAEKGTTEDYLIANAQWIAKRSDPDDGYQLVIDVLAQTIQADGTIDGTENGTPVVEAIWGVNADGSVNEVKSDGTLDIQTANQGG